MKKFDVYGSWIISTPITTIKEREFIYILAESAGMEIYQIDRVHTYIDTLPMLCKDLNTIYSCSEGYMGITTFQKVTKGVVIEALKKAIKERQV